jgi:septal ring-binding cell division protein DamX
VAHTHDDGFHEIQLSGKQLAFLVMAATVVSVVIFLFGVLVGRGVRAERSAIDASAAPAAFDAPAPPTAAPPPPAGEDPTKAAEAPAPPADDAEKVVPDRAAKGIETKEPPPRPAPEKTKEPAPPPPAAAAGNAKATAEPAGPGYAVQIAALNVRSEADAIAKRLTSKGYSAYVLTPASGSPSVFRVRVGKFQTRREAENVAARLQKEEQFRPWVTR